MLVGRLLFLEGAFPAGQVPDFETSRPTDERDLTLQLQLLAEIDGEKEAALLIDRGVRGASVELAQENTPLDR